MTQSTCNEQSASIAQLGDRPIKLAATRLCYTPYTAATELDLNLLAIVGLAFLNLLAIVGLAFHLSVNGQKSVRAIPTS